MTAVATRLVVFAGSTQDPRTPTDPQVALIQGLVGLSLDPQRFQLEYPLLPPNSDFYDVLVSEAFDKSAYVVLYECELQQNGEFIVKRDLFGKNDYVLTWSGWPIPGDPPPTPPGDTPPAVPQTIVLTTAEKQALAFIRKKRKAR
jgi:hypothetical protein